jgi:ABC-2 type transport system permease protein
MFSLFKKEIRRFFSALTAYVVILVFLLINSLYMWIFPGELNILDAGYATIDTLFIISPWVFLFLIPAITMRMFAEEKKSGTLDLLLTRPLSDFQIVLAKYSAALALVVFSLVPCLVYFLTVYFMGNPPGNIDTGGTWGSFIGLFFLAAAYTGFGIFSSSITDNMIISFIIAVCISFFFFIGFDYLSQLNMFGRAATLILDLGIYEHYKSISRGVIYLKDIIYFVSIVSIFLLFTRTILNKRRW